MSNTSQPSESPPLSPCTGICRLDARGFCVGCQRTGDEIGKWRTMSNPERWHVMQVLLPLRKLP